MKRLAAVLIILVTAATASAMGKNDTLEANEQAAWQAFKEKNVEAFKKLVSPELVTVFADGVSNLQGELDAMSKSETKSFKLSNLKVTALDDNNAIVTYTAELESTFNGNDVTGTYYCGTIWQLKNGEWRAVFHTDTKAATKPSA